MAPFKPVYLLRSDGKLEIEGHHKKVERNEPTPEQLDRKPDANGVSDYYREIGIDEPKHLDWRRKLGGLLAKGLSAPDLASTGYMLLTLPTNYRLYEHVKRAEGEGQTVKNVKTHAGGGNERQDAYLYGHPLGRKKRYRSPADFYPHLLWLCTDEKGDPDNCSCKICCPEELQEVKPAQIRKTAVSETPVQAIPAAKTAIQVPTRPTPSPATAQSALAPSQANQLPSKSMSEDQELDLTYSTFMFRQGELAWYNRGQAWGLGMVVRRWKQSDAQGLPSSRSYTMQPLSHPFKHPPLHTVHTEDSLRPFLAWSLPGYTTPNLNQIPNLRYESTDWNGIFQHKYGSGDIEVDASILAARAVDPTIVTFDPIVKQAGENGLTETYWNGLYLGAEKVWLNDILRLRTTNPADVFVVRAIVECNRTSALNNQIIESSLRLRGDIYTFTTISHNDTTRLFPANTDLSALPQRLVQDLRLRNKSTIPTRRTASLYRLTRTNIAIETRDVKGRWYEATLLNPLLDRNGWAAEYARGDIVEGGLRMNARLDCNAGKGQIGATSVQEVRKGTRIEAFGKSVPSTTLIREGSRPQQQDLQQQQVGSGRTEAMQIDPAFGGGRGGAGYDGRAARQENGAVGGHQGRGQGQGQLHGDGQSFEDLMNMDGLDQDGGHDDFGAGFGGGGY